jgi:hypothetical protein
MPGVRALHRDIPGEHSSATCAASRSVLRTLPTRRPFNDTSGAGVWAVTCVESARSRPPGCSKPSPAACGRKDEERPRPVLPASRPHQKAFSEVCRASGRRTRAANYSFDDHKRQLPTKRIGLGLLLALAIRGLPHGWRLTAPSRLKRTRLRASCPEPPRSCSGWSDPCRTERRLGPAGLAYPASRSGGSGLPPAPRHDGPRRW